MDRQRKVIYGERREVLEGADLQEQIGTFIDDVVTGTVLGSLDEFAETWNLKQLWTDLGQFWPIALDHTTLEDEAGGRAALDRSELVKVLQEDAHRAYAEREQEVGEEVMRESSAACCSPCSTASGVSTSTRWTTCARASTLRAYSQRDPLVEYQREGFDMFTAMMDGIKEEAVGFLFNLEVQVDEEEDDAEGGFLFEGEDDEVEEPLRRELRSEDQPAHKEAPHIHAKGLEMPKQPQNLSYSAPTEDGEVEVRGATATNADDEFADVGRNSLCPCGSGKKYKRCHGAPGGPTGVTARLG